MVRSFVRNVKGRNRFKLPANALVSASLETSMRANRFIRNEEKRHSGECASALLRLLLTRLP